MPTQTINKVFTAVEIIVAGALGILVAVLGTSAYRSFEPFGLIFVLVAVLATSVMVRAWRGLIGLAAFGVLFVVVVQIFALEGPGGDVLMPADTLTYVWLVTGVLMIGVAAFTPKKWYLDNEKSLESAPER